jgi:hypothetical protein
LTTIGSVINIDDKLVRVGTAAGASAKDINGFRRAVFATAQMPDIKMDTAGLIEASEVITGTGVSLGFVQNNLRNIGLLMKGVGLSGAEAGALFNGFEKLGYTTGQISSSMDRMADLTDAGKGMGLNFLAKALPGLMEMHSVIGDTPEDMEKLVTAMQVLGKGTKSDTRAVAAFNSIMNELADPQKRDALQRGLGIKIKNEDTGRMRDFGGVMKDLAAVKETFGNFDVLNRVFSNTSMDAIRAYDRWGQVAENLENIGDSAGAVQKRAAQNAGTTASNLKNLQTAWLSFASERLAAPLEKLTGFLNYMVEHPKIATTAMWGLVGAVTALGAVKIGAGVLSFVTNLKMLKGGSGINLKGLAAGAGGAGIPVYVTNLGGSPGLQDFTPPKNSVPGAAKAAPAGLAGTAKLLGLAGLFTLPVIYREEMKEISGAVTPALRKVSEALSIGGKGHMGGGGLWEEMYGQGMGFTAGLAEEAAAVPSLPDGTANPQAGGSAEIITRVDVYDNRVEAKTSVGRNDTPFIFPTGDAREAQRMGL